MYLFPTLSNWFNKEVLFLPGKRKNKSEVKRSCTIYIIYSEHLFQFKRIEKGPEIPFRSVVISRSNPVSSSP